MFFYFIRHCRQGFRQNFLTEDIPINGRQVEWTENKTLLRYMLIRVNVT